MDVKRLGRVEYQDALDLQQTLVEQRKRGEIGDQLLLLERMPQVPVGATFQALNFVFRGDVDGRGM